MKRAERCALAILVWAVIAETGPCAGAVLSRELVPMGDAIGITVRTRGVIVAELSELETKGGCVSPAKDAGLLPGDVITMVGCRQIDKAQDLIEALDGHGGEELKVRYTRDGAERETTVTPYDDEGRCYMGFWIKDGVSGIGTLTWYDPETGEYGALGHPVSDGETGQIVPVGEGSIIPAEVTGVTQGKAGTPGRLGGVFKMDQPMGDIRRNNAAGIFGEITESCTFGEIKKTPVAEKSEIKVGSATILSAAGGTVKEYEIEITRLYRGNSDGRSMMIRVTDPELLAITGGIVQGMSGSPIMQDGRLVGAVTHVLINDPTKGYAVAAEDMLKMAG